VTEEYRSGLSEERVEELARQIMRVVCDEHPSLGNRLPSSVIHDRLREDGVELPDYAMRDAIYRLGDLITFPLGGSQNPDDPAHDEEVRRHGGITIVSAKTEYCDEF
jgi:hypothetical protein